MYLKSSALVGFSFLATYAVSLPAHSQSFSVDTNVSQTAFLYSYAFTLNYDQPGVVQSLTDPIYDWTFFIDPTLAAPTQVLLPTGWQESYDPASGQFDFYTEGPGGFGSGDFGSYVIQPGQSLSGFGLTTSAVPGDSIAFATDEQFNQDAALAVLPTTLPAAVPEASTAVSLGVGCLPLLVLAVRRHRKRGAGRLNVFVAIGIACVLFHVLRWCRSQMCFWRPACIAVFRSTSRGAGMASKPPAPNQTRSTGRSLFFVPPLSSPTRSACRVAARVQLSGGGGIRSEAEASSERVKPIKDSGSSEAGW